MDILGKELSYRLADIILANWMPISTQFPGTRGAGKMLEHLLFGTGDRYLPQAEGWFLAFSGGKTQITLFRKDGEPAEHLNHLIRNYSIKTKDGNRSFMRTVRANQSGGFSLVNHSGRIRLCHTSDDDQLPSWSHDSLINAFTSRYRRLLLVTGRVKKFGGSRHVRYNRAHAYLEPIESAIVPLIEQSLIAVKFNDRADAEGERAGIQAAAFIIRQADLWRLFGRTERVP